MTTKIAKQDSAEFAFGTICTPKQNGLIFNKDATFDEWASVGSTLRGIEGAVWWWLGDWWLHGERAYGDMASQEAQENVLAETGLDYDAVRQHAWVSSRFEFVTRCNKLSFSHHRVAAGIEDKEKRMEWLKTAEVENLNVRELKASILAGHVVHVRDMLDAAEGKVSLNLIQGIVPKTRMWLTNVAPKIKWDKRLADQLIEEVINPMEEMCQEMRTKLLGTTADKDI